MADRRVDPVEIANGSGPRAELNRSGHRLLEPSIDALEFKPCCVLTSRKAAVACELGVNRTYAGIADRKGLSLTFESPEIDAATSIGQLLAAVGRFPALLNPSIQSFPDLEQSLSQRAIGGEVERLGEAGSGLHGTTDEEPPGFAKRKGIDSVRKCSDTTGHGAGYDDPRNPHGGRRGGREVPRSARKEHEGNGTGDHGNGKGGDHCEEHSGFETTHHRRGG